MMLPPIIQGGMGVAVSGWPLASAVSREGQCGVVSGTAMPMTLVHRLQSGDRDGQYRKALTAFPSQTMAQRVLQRWYIPGGTPAGVSLANPPMPTWPLRQDLLELTVAGVFAEIYLAKLHGGTGPVGVNLLTKVEVLTLPSLYGAMLAGVDVVFMGAGIPRSIPGALDAFARGEIATLPLTVAGSDSLMMHLDPSELLGFAAPTLNRPAFFPIVSSQILASILLRKSNGTIDGFVIEHHSAGGHNAPPRGGAAARAGKSPVWQERDQASLKAFREIGLPFYLAGGQDGASALRLAQEQGAAGVQIGTAFAFCRESGLREDLKSRVLDAVGRNQAQVITDPLASPAGLPFKVIQLPGTLSDLQLYLERQRRCELGHLRTACRRSDGTLAWRCPAEPEQAYLAKGGKPEELLGRRCLCAGLLSAAGITDPLEPAILTAGDALVGLARFLPPGQLSYSARDVIQQITGH